MLFFNNLYKLKFLSLFLIISLVAGNLYSCPLIYAAADTSDLNFKVYNPGDTETTNTKPSSNVSNITTPSLIEETSTKDSTQIIDQAEADTAIPAKPTLNETSTVEGKADENKVDEVTKNGEVSTTINAEDEGKSKLLQGYVRIVPSGTKISIIMDTAVDSDTSQEGDEFSARTAEDLTIDGATAVPAGSIIRGRIATLNAPKHLNRSGSVALKFDSVTTPDNRQIPLVANLVARGGVVHARRGLKDIAIDTGTFALPTAVALGIGAVAGHSSSSVGTGGGALIGAAVGAAIGICILMAKKGKRVDVHPGDELKIELAEDLHMPSM